MTARARIGKALAALAAEPPRRGPAACSQEPEADLGKPAKDQPTITHTHTWDGPHNLPHWLHWDGGLTLPGRDDTTPPQPGWMLVRWSDGIITVNSPQAADRTFGPDGIWGRLQRAEAELRQHAENESADAAAGSYAGRAEAAEATLRRIADLADQWGKRTDQLRVAADHIRVTLAYRAPAIAHPEPWLHVTFTSPDPTTANTSALALADFVRAEFPSIRMRITTNAVEVGTHDARTNPAATEATDIETSARVYDALHRSAEETVTRVIDLHERWSKTGPPLGVSMTGYFEWWRGLLVELHDAINPPAEQPAPTTPNTAPGLREQLYDAIEHQVYEYRERTMLWGETEGVTEEITRLATRGALSILQANPTPVRDLIDTALRTTPRAGCADWPAREAHGHGHRYDMRCALCVGEADTLTDAVLAALGEKEQQPYPPIGLTNQEKQP